MARFYMYGSENGLQADFELCSRAHEDELTDPADWCAEQRFMHDWFNRNAVDGFLPKSVPIDGLFALVGYIHKIEISVERDDFRYRIYGERIAYAANCPMQGRWVSEFAPIVAKMFLKIYRDLRDNPRFYVGVTRYEGEGLRTPAYYRAIVPVGNTETGTQGFITLDLPEDKQGMLVPAATPETAVARASR
ncbi:hypothetical protein HH303_04960 [Rhodospirillaceae bacterium KN72]|uniref:PAS domain-containing protein n=1 Tax=Pacificispira spongiicola TaxID=2729598 RepID=A0A7Y0DYA5_9PROT|nr:hypothetical protein [Pacificispira spongiicola]NMM43815.1 hypothetical protein [Pacificispira spongiicola]